MKDLVSLSEQLNQLISRFRIDRPVAPTSESSEAMTALAGTLRTILDHLTGKGSTPQPAEPPTEPEPKPLPDVVKELNTLLARLPKKPPES